MTEGDEKTDGRSCPSCQGRGFTWDYDDYDGFYALCTHCDGSGQIEANSAASRSTPSSQETSPGASTEPS